MGVAVLVGTAKGAVLLRSEGDRRGWERSPLLHKGWLVTAATRDARGRTYVGVTHDVWGAVILVSDDLESWEQLEAAPRYEPSQRGHPEHLRIVGAMDPLGRFKDGARHVDQIWKLHAVGDVVYAGVSEAGLFRSDDNGKSWQGVPGLNDHPGREDWGPGFGGLCAHSVLADRRNPDRIWVGISAAGVFRSDDGGRSFAAKNGGVSRSEAFCVHSLAHDPDDADVIYRQDHRGVYRSRDAGDTWQVIETGLPLAELGDGHHCVFGFPVALDPRSGALFVIPLEGDSFRFARDGRLAVYRSLDGGDHWERCSEGLPEDCYANVLRGSLALDHLDPCGVYFGSTSGCVYGSADGGDTWSELIDGLPKILCVEAFEVS